MPKVAFTTHITTFNLDTWTAQAQAEYKQHIAAAITGGATRCTDHSCLPCLDCLGRCLGWIADLPLNTTPERISPRVALLPPPSPLQ